MINEERVLAYEKATELKDSDLVVISGGSIKKSLSNITNATGYYPGPLDADIIQVWD